MLPPDAGRRRFSKFLCAGTLATLTGCGGSIDDEPPANAAQGQWDVMPSKRLIVAPGMSFDLNTTLPAGVARGGLFDVDPSGVALPPGITLSSRGVLTVTAAATGSAAGVVFRYTPPA
jgi:hypothetical protein